MPTSDYTPTVAEVAAYVRARTKDDNGAEAGTFNANTRPTSTQVSSLITNAVGVVSRKVGNDLDAEFQDAAQALAALRTAMFIELSYFPEQVREGRSNYEELKALYDEDMATLVSSMLDDEPGRKGLFSIPLRSEGYLAAD